MNRKHILARELRSIVRHETGHLIAVRHFGGNGRIEVWRNPIPSPNEKAIRGRLLYSLPKLSPVERAAFGIAGELAYCLASNPDLRPDEFLAHIEGVDFDAQSSADRKAIGDHPEAGTELAFAILWQRATELESVYAEELARWARSLQIDLR